MTDEERLAAEVVKVIEDKRDRAELNPAWIATEVMQNIDFPRRLHELGYAGCHLELRQIARQKLRGKFDPADFDDPSAADDPRQEDMFSDKLQDRYPRRPKPGEAPTYALLGYLSEDDVNYNVERMRRNGRALMRHAAALEKWWVDRIFSAN